MKLLYYERDKFGQIQTVEGAEEVPFSIEKRASIPVHLRFRYEESVWSELMAEVLSVHEAEAIKKIKGVHIQPSFGLLSDKCQGLALVHLTLKDGRNAVVQRVVQFTPREMVDFASWFVSTEAKEVHMHPKIHEMHKKDIVEFLTKHTI